MKYFRFADVVKKEALCFFAKENCTSGAATAEGENLNEEGQWVVLWPKPLHCASSININKLCFTHLNTV